MGLILGHHLCQSVSQWVSECGPHTWPPPVRCGRDAAVSASPEKQVCTCALSVGPRAILSPQAPCSAECRPYHLVRPGRPCRSRSRPAPRDQRAVHHTVTTLDSQWHPMREASCRRGIVHVHAHVRMCMLSAARSAQAILETGHIHVAHTLECMHTCAYICTHAYMHTCIYAHMCMHARDGAVREALPSACSAFGFSSTLEGLISQCWRPRLCRCACAPSGPDTRGAAIAGRAAGRKARMERGIGTGQRGETASRQVAGVARAGIYQA